MKKVNSKNNVKRDIVIIGGGPAGLSLACSLADTSLKITIIEKQSVKYLSSPSYDGREIALTHFSKKILEDLGVWKRIPPNPISPIKEAKVLDGNSSYVLHFDSHKVHKEALGYLVSNHLIKKALYEKVITRPNIEVITNTSVVEVNSRKQYATVKTSDKKTIRAPLIVAADSRFSQTRENMGISASIYDFERVAIVCRMQHEKRHHNIAYECFHYGETLAVLPLMKNASSIIMTIPAEKSEILMNMNKKKFNTCVANKFKNKFGKMKLLNKRYSYPLVGVYADRFVANRFAVIGDAAVGMHPVTAHGFNLGLRGQNTLSLQIKFALKRKLDFGLQKILEKYEMKHRRASKPLYLGTNAIVKLYTGDSLFSKIARKAMLRIGNNFTPVKNRIINQLTEISL
jgi:ubiquinone biosynthesis UbiH/UbiF/VisC/COQ6 family hydroxylase